MLFWVCFSGKSKVKLGKCQKGKRKSKMSKNYNYRLEQHLVSRVIDVRRQVLQKIAMLLAKHSQQEADVLV